MPSTSVLVQFWIFCHLEIYQISAIQQMFDKPNCLISGSQDRRAGSSVEKFDTGPAEFDCPQKKLTDFYWFAVRHTLQCFSILSVNAFACSILVPFSKSPNGKIVLENTRFCCPHFWQPRSSNLVLCEKIWYWTSRVQPPFFRGGNAIKSFVNALFILHLLPDS